MTGGPRGKDGPDVREMVPEMDGTLIGLEDGGREYPNSGFCTPHGNGSTDVDSSLLQYPLPANILLLYAAALDEHRDSTGFSACVRSL